MNAYRPKPQTSAKILFDVLQAQDHPSRAARAGQPRPRPAPGARETGKIRRRGGAPLNRDGDGSRRAGMRAGSPCRQRPQAYPDLRRNRLAGALRATRRTAARACRRCSRWCCTNGSRSQQAGPRQACCLAHLRCYKHHASAELKNTARSRPANGSRPCATARATRGSDLGLVRTRAVPQDDGSYPLVAPRSSSRAASDLERQHRAPGALAACPSRPAQRAAVPGAKFYPTARSSVVCKRIEGDGGCTEADLPRHALRRRSTRLAGVSERQGASTRCS